MPHLSPRDTSPGAISTLMSSNRYDTHAATLAAGGIARGNRRRRHPAGPARPQLCHRGLSVGPRDHGAAAFHVRAIDPAPDRLRARGRHPDPGQADHPQLRRRDLPDTHGSFRCRDTADLNWQVSCLEMTVNPYQGFRLSLIQADSGRLVFDQHTITVVLVPQHNEMRF
jgi:hypothetical protein